MKTSIICLATILIFISGCADLKRSQIVSMNKEQLCHTYSINNDNTVRARLKLLYALTVKEWKQVDSGKVNIGTSELALQCIFGKPKKVNSTTNKYGTHKQWVYHNNVYIYTEDGKVTSWQN